MNEPYASFYEQARKRYAPTLLSYTPEEEGTLRARIEAFLRPAYEKALARQRQEAAAYNGALDADAWSRGMGRSTYVSDLKQRRQNALLDGAVSIEGDYAAALGEQLYKALSQQQERQLETEKFNAQALNQANSKALAAADAMYKSYLASLKGRRSGASAWEQEKPNRSETPMGEEAGSEDTGALKELDALTNQKLSGRKRSSGDPLRRDRSFSLR